MIPVVQQSLGNVFRIQPGSLLQPARKTNFREGFGSRACLYFSLGYELHSDLRVGMPSARLARLDNKVLLG